MQMSMYTLAEWGFHRIVGPTAVYYTQRIPLGMNGWGLEERG
jgi:hypothetical protein